MLVLSGEGQASLYIKPRRAVPSSRSRAINDSSEVTGAAAARRSVMSWAVVVAIDETWRKLVVAVQGQRGHEQPNYTLQWAGGARLGADFVRTLATRH